MSSKIAIINVAMRRLGQEPIVSLTEGSRAANLASPHYDELLPVMTRSNQWNWATKRVELARSARTPVSTFDYQFFMPADNLRTVVVSASDLGVTDLDYKLAHDDTDGDVLLTDSTQVFLTYVASITDPARMPPDFRYALSMAIARDLAYPLTSSAGIADRMDQAAQAAWMRAVSTDAIEDMPDRRPEGSWVQSRYGQYSKWPS